MTARVRTSHVNLVEPEVVPLRQPSSKAGRIGEVIGRRLRSNSLNDGPSVDCSGSGVAERGS
jgi:hypothetical protein